MAEEDLYTRLRQKMPEYNNIVYRSDFLDFLSKETQKLKVKEGKYMYQIEDLNSKCNTSSDSFKNIIKSKLAKRELEKIYGKLSDVQGQLERMPDHVEWTLKNANGIIEKRKMEDLNKAMNEIRRENQERYIEEQLNERRAKGEKIETEEEIHKAKCNIERKDFRNRVRARINFLKQEQETSRDSSLHHREIRDLERELSYEKSPSERAQIERIDQFNWNRDNNYDFDPLWTKIHFIHGTVSLAHRPNEGWFPNMPWSAACRPMKSHQCWDPYGGIAITLQDKYKPGSLNKVVYPGTEEAYLTRFDQPYEKMAKSSFSRALTDI
jgi:hypothetical protein